MNRENLENKNGVGIRVELVQDSHTSKCSFLDNESVGRKIKRCLFKASDGRLINADVNGALNIMKRGLDLEKLFDVSSGVFQTRRKNPNATHKRKQMGRGAVAVPQETSSLGSFNGKILPLV